MRKVISMFLAIIILTVICLQTYSAADSQNAGSSPKFTETAYKNLLNTIIRNNDKKLTAKDKTNIKTHTQGLNSKNSADKPNAIQQACNYIYSSMFGSPAPSKPYVLVLTADVCLADTGNESAASCLQNVLSFAGMMKESADVSEYAQYLHNKNLIALIPAKQPANLEKVESEGNIAAIAKQFRDRYYNLLTAKEKSASDKDIKSAPKIGTDRSEYYLKLSSFASASCFSGIKAQAAYYIAAAAVEFPKEPLIINNFGTLLDLIGERQQAVKILIYARSIDRNAPVILTNLGNSLLEQGDFTTAERLYDEALEANQQFGPAHYGKAILYRYVYRDYEKAAWEALLASNLTPMKSLMLKQNIDEEQNNIGNDLKQSNDNTDNHDFNQYANMNDLNAILQKLENVIVKPERLDIPDLPKMDTPEMLYYCSFENMLMDISHKLGELQRQTVSFDMPINTPMAGSEQFLYVGFKSCSSAFLSKLTGLKENLSLEKIYEEKLKRIEKEFLDKKQKLVDKMNESLDKNKKAYESGEVEVYDDRTPKADYVKDLLSLMNEAFQSYYPFIKGCYNEYAVYETRYWTGADTYMKLFNLKSTFDGAQHERKMFVAMGIKSCLETIMDAQKSYYALFEEAMENNGLIVADKTITMPDKEYKGNHSESEFSLSINFGSFDLLLSNSSIGVAFKAGFATSLDYTFRNSDISLLVGLGAKGQAGALGTGGVGTNIGGIMLTGNLADGTLTDVGVGGDMSVKATVAYAVAAESKLGGYVSLNNGLQTEYAFNFAGM